MAAEGGWGASLSARDEGPLRRGWFWEGKKRGKKGRAMKRKGEGKMAIETGEEGRRKKLREVK